MRKAIITFSTCFLVFFASCIFATISNIQVGGNRSIMMSPSTQLQLDWDTSVSALDSEAGRAIINNLSQTPTDIVAQIVPDELDTGGAKKITVSGWNYGRYGYPTTTKTDAGGKRYVYVQGVEGGSISGFKFGADNIHIDAMIPPNNYNLSGALKICIGVSDIKDCNSGNEIMSDFHFIFYIEAPLETSVIQNLTFPPIFPANHSQLQQVDRDFSNAAMVATKGSSHVYYRVTVTPTRLVLQKPGVPESLSPIVTPLNMRCSTCSVSAIPSPWDMTASFYGNIDYSSTEESAVFYIGANETIPANIPPGTYTGNLTFTVTPTS